MPGIIAIGASHGGLEKGLDLIQPTAADGIEALQRVFALPRACIARGDSNSVRRADYVGDYVYNFIARRGF